MGAAAFQEAFLSLLFVVLNGAGCALAKRCDSLFDCPQFCCDGVCCTFEEKRGGMSSWSGWSSWSGGGGGGRGGGSGGIRASSFHLPILGLAVVILAFVGCCCFAMYKCKQQGRSRNLDRVFSTPMTPVAPAAASQGQGQQEQQPFVPVNQPYQPPPSLAAAVDPSAPLPPPDLPPPTYEDATINKKEEEQQQQQQQPAYNPQY